MRARAFEFWFRGMIKHSEKVDTGKIYTKIRTVYMYLCISTPWTTRPDQISLYEVQLYGTL